MIKVKDIVLHILSGNYYKCENAKHERWMNMNPYYKLVKIEEAKNQNNDRTQKGF